MPDTIYELIDEKVHFQAVHGPSKYHSEPLHVQRMFLAYDNVEVLNPSETVEYSSALDGPIYRCVIESSKLRGYVRLKLQEIEVKRALNDRPDQSPKPELIRTFSFVEGSKVNSIPDLENANDDDVFITQVESRKSKLTPIEKKISNMQSGISKQLSMPSLSDEPTDKPIYEAVTDHYMLRPLKVTNSRRMVTAKLPNWCISSVEVKVFEEYDEMEALTKRKFQNIEEYHRATKNMKRKPALFKKIAYLNSFEFAGHFGDIFAQHIGELLGLNQKTIDISMMQGSVIYTNVMANGHVINYEIIPSTTSSWPDEAYEWALRPRETVHDARSKIAYRWPTPGMIERVKSLPCHILPIGFIPKHGFNVEQEFQWRLAFPAAQRFLESCLTHSQMRCYLFMLTLYKSFIEPRDTKLGLTPDHLKTFLFWECERDFVRWPEERLGEKLKLLLLKLRMYLEYQSLPDYFLPQRNLFENIPTSNLLIAHRKIADILENPVMYTLKALRNLKYTHPQFYPAMDFKNLFHLLETDRSLHRNVDASELDEINEKVLDELVESDGDEEEEDIQTRWYREAYKRIQEEKKEKEAQAKIKEKIAKKRRLSTDSIKTGVSY